MNNIWENIQHLSPEGLRELYGMLKHLPHSTNQRGYYFDLANIPSDVMDNVTKYIAESNKIHQDFLKGERDRDQMLFKLHNSINLNKGKVVLMGSKPENDLFDDEDEDEEQDGYSVATGLEDDEDDEQSIEVEYGDEDEENFDLKAKNLKDKWSAKEKVCSSLYYPSKHWPPSIQREKDKEYSDMVQACEPIRKKGRNLFSTPLK